MRDLETVSDVAEALQVEGNLIVYLVNLQIDDVIVSPSTVATLVEWIPVADSDESTGFTVSRNAKQAVVYSDHRLEA